MGSAPICGTGDGSLKPEAIILQDSMVGSIEYLGDGGKEMTILNGRKSKPTLEKDGFELLQLEAPLLLGSEINRSWMVMILSSSRIMTTSAWLR